VFHPIKEGADRQDTTVTQAKQPEIIGGLPQRVIAYPGEQNKQFGIHTPILGDKNPLPQRVSATPGQALTRG
jgi:hypothetical protein